MADYYDLKLAQLRIRRRRSQARGTDMSAAQRVHDLESVYRRYPASTAEEGARRSRILMDLCERAAAEQTDQRLAPAWRWEAVAYLDMAEAYDHDEVLA